MTSMETMVIDPLAPDAPPDLDPDGNRRSLSPWTTGVPRRPDMDHVAKHVKGRHTSHRG